MKNLPKLENRFLPAIWVGKDAASGETLLGIATKVVRSRTIKRQPEVQQATDGYHQQQRTEQVPNSRYNSTTTSSIQTSTENNAGFSQTTGEQTTAQQQRQQPQLPITDSPMATAPTHHHQRPSLPSSKRTLPDEVAEGSSSKQTRRQEAPTGLTRPEATAEPATSKQRITAVTVKTNKGQEITAGACKDTNEHR